MLVCQRACFDGQSILVAWPMVWLLQRNLNILQIDQKRRTYFGNLSLCLLVQAMAPQCS